MKIEGSVALVTGANRGLGQVYARELVRRGAAKVYGAARKPAAVTEPGVTPIGLDITDPEQVASVAGQCTDVSLLANNAGVLTYNNFISAADLSGARREMETNYFGTLSMCRAFAPVLAANGGGAIVNMLSVSRFYSNPFDAVEAGQVEVLCDERSRTVKAELSRDQELIYPPVQKFWDDAIKGGS
jgi:NAD(P)-dependent dehydrogenase (short-subunit alcohol dehydrogenase family)